jgi:hypothetical protein
MILKRIKRLINVKCWRYFGGPNRLKELEQWYDSEYNNHTKIVGNSHIEPNIKCIERQFNEYRKTINLRNEIFNDLKILCMFSFILIVIGRAYGLWMY